MLPLIVFGLLGALPAMAGDPAGPVSPATLYTDYQHEVPDAIREAIRHEVDSIISPAGLTFEWRSLGALQTGSCIRLAVVHFKGDCSVTDLPVYPEYAFTLGSTVVNDGEVLPFTDIYCNAIRAFMAPQLVSQTAVDRNVSFGRAAGRVLAHELYHIFAATKHHSSHGLAEPAWRVPELMREDFRLSGSDMERLRARVMPALLQANGLVGKSPGNPGKVSFLKSGCSGCHGPEGKGTQWGPSLHAAQRSYNHGKLRYRLSDTHTEMYQRARQLGVLWPALTEADIADLASFLKTDIQ